MAKPLVIVESPAKARTLARLLGDRYRVEASVGHVRDLPENASEVPADIKDKPWGRMGVDVDNGFRPYYVISRDKVEPHPRPARRREGRARGPARHRPGPRGRVDQLAPARGAQAEGPGPPHRVPRDHARGRAQGHRRGARHRPAARRRAGEPPHRRPAVRLHGVAGALEEGADRAQRRPRAERGRAPHRRARGGAPGIPDERVLEPRGAPELVRAARSPPRWRASGPARLATGRDFDPATGHAEGRQRCACWTRRSAGELRDALDGAAAMVGDLGRGAARHAGPVRAVHHLDAAAGGEPQARASRPIAR